MRLLTDVKPGITAQQWLDIKTTYQPEGKQDDKVNKIGPRIEPWGTPQTTIKTGSPASRVRMSLETLRRAVSVECNGQKPE